MIITKRGFTIAELLVVIVAVGILAAISLVAYSNMAGRAFDTSVKQDLHNNIRRMQLYAAEKGSLPNTVELATSYAKEAKPKVSSRKAYKRFGICSGGDEWGSPVKEVLYEAHSSSGGLFAFSTINGAIEDRSEDFNALTEGQQKYPCKYLLRSKQFFEYRNLIRHDGAVESGFVDILGP